MQLNTEVIAGEGMIVTAGGIDCHVHFICPQLYQEAISSGKTVVEIFIDLKILRSFIQSRVSSHHELFSSMK